ncbi:LacI family DNA-binding transcriptional regulator [Vibrio owensii]|uniref:LacI family DNA-binding transcriptional regulator n=1 Tax=Vibrio owensii TaxID=696485 RepID=UPI002F3FF993
MARIKDVAELAGVNRSTVSRIINGEGKFREETKKKVEAAMAELNYRPSAIARSLATSSSNMVGLLVTYYTGGFFGEMMEQVQTELDMHKKFLITAQGHHSAEGEKEAIQRFNDLRCDGYVLHSRYLSDDDLRELAKLPTPFVLLDRYVEGIEERCVTFNHHHASRIAVEHLIAGGHRQSGYDAMAAIYHRHPEMTAVFSCSEEMTVGAMQFLHEKRIPVPEQISLVSFDSVDLCESLYPTVSAVHFPISEMARVAVQTLMGLIKDQQSHTKPVFEAELKLRKADRTLF